MAFGPLVIQASITLTWYQSRRVLFFPLLSQPQPPPASAPRHRVRSPPAASSSPPAARPPRAPGLPSPLPRAPRALPAADSSSASAAVHRRPPRPQLLLRCASASSPQAHLHRGASPRPASLVSVRRSAAAYGRQASFGCFVFDLDSFQKKKLIVSYVFLVGLCCDSSLPGDFIVYCSFPMC